MGPSPSRARQRLALDKLHDEVRLSVVISHRIHRDNVRMIELRCRARLGGTEPRQALWQPTGLAGS